jgi:hypothetical protein
MTVLTCVLFSDVLATYSEKLPWKRKKNLPCFPIDVTLLIAAELQYELSTLKIDLCLL